MLSLLDRAFSSSLPPQIASLQSWKKIQKTIGFCIYIK